MNPRLEEIIAELDPDVICEDNVRPSPRSRPRAALVRIVSCNPLEVRDPEIPPVFSGYAAADRSGWEEFMDERDRTHRPLWTEFNEFCQEAGAPPLPELEFIDASPYLNLLRLPGRASTISVATRSNSTCTGSKSCVRSLTPTSRSRGRPRRRGRARRSVSPDSLGGGR